MQIAKIQIAIEIPEDIYKSKDDEDYIRMCASDICEAFENGTVLPKHGRLGDLDALEQYVIDKYSEGEQLAIDISDAPTILEADKESAE